MAAMVAVAATPAVLAGAHISLPPPRSSLVVIPLLPRRALFTSSGSCSANISGKALSHSIVTYFEQANLFLNFFFYDSLLT